jgi:hypothetical protein
MCGKDRAVNVFKLGTMPGIITGLTEVCFREFNLAEGLCAIRGSPNHIYVALFVGCGNRFWLPFGEDSSLAERPE